MDIDLEPIRRAFQAEVEEDLATVEQELLALEKAPDDAERVASVFRKFHSLKGNAAGLGLERVSGFAHRVEDLLDRLRRGEARFSSGHVSFLLQVVDALRQVLPALGRGEDALPSAAEGLLRQLVDGRLQPPGGGEAAGGVDGELERAAEAGGGTLRIDVSRLDALLGVTSEIAIARARLELLIERDGTPEMAAAYLGLERLLGQLHRSVSKVRMVPIAPLLRHYGRVVRDLALAEGKRAELRVEDFGVEVDTSVIDRLRAPLTHMVRNAVHHGLEPPAARLAAGKPEQGRVALRARHEGAEIVIQVEDDGAGIDRGALLERARALGLPIEPLQTGQQVDELVFVQGLSTAREVSGTSGRGVGMDVVRRHIDALGGAVAVSSEPGRGTRITVRMPLTLAIIECLLARVGQAPLVIPMAGIVRCLDLGRGGGNGDAPDGVADVGGSAVPFVRLRAEFGGGGSPGLREVLVVIDRGGERLGLAVDQLVGRAQAVVKPPGRYFAGLPAVSGLTILGDGQVAPVLDVAGLVAARRRPGGAAGAARGTA